MILQYVLSAWRPSKAYCFWLLSYDSPELGHKRQSREGQGNAKLHRDIQESVIVVCPNFDNSQTSPRYHVLSENLLDAGRSSTRFVYINSFNHPSNLGGRQDFIPPFPDEKWRLEQVKKTCPRSLRVSRGKVEFQLRQCGSRTGTSTHLSQIVNQAAPVFFPQSLIAAQGMSLWLRQRTVGATGVSGSPPLPSLSLKPVCFLHLPLALDGVTVLTV